MIATVTSLVGRACARLISTPPSGVSDDEQSIWDGPDDIWPPEQAAENAEDLTTTVVQQWGLSLPDGSIIWGSWHGIVFSNPLDRMRMVATLQKTGLDIGLADGDQLNNFLTQYGWAVRDATVTTVFTTVRSTYGLTDPAVTEVTTTHAEGDSPEVVAT